MCRVIQVDLVDYSRITDLGMQITKYVNIIKKANPPIQSVINSNLATFAVAKISSAVSVSKNSQSLSGK